MGEPTIVHLAASARTAAEAAAAIGCTVAQIAKSLIFKGKTSGEHILVIASGAHRVDEARVAAAIGEPLGKADADFVRERTGYAIGAVAPIGHLRPPRHVLVELGSGEASTPYGRRPAIPISSSDYPMPTSSG